MKIKITYKELSIILGILVAIMAIFSYWLTLHQGNPKDASIQLQPITDFEIVKFSTFIRSVIQAGLTVF